MKLSPNIKIFATGGMILGMYYSIKKEKSIKELITFTLFFGIAGGLIGGLADKGFSIKKQ